MYVQEIFGTCHLAVQFKASVLIGCLGLCQQSALWLLAVQPHHTFYINNVASTVTQVGGCHRVIVVGQGGTHLAVACYLVVGFQGAEEYGLGPEAGYHTVP